MWGGFSSFLTKVMILQRLQDSGYLYQIHPAETAAGLTDADLTFGYEPFNVLRYGADRTAANPSDTAAANAALVCGATGSTIRWPAGDYTLANPASFKGLTSIIWQGDGAASAGAQPATRITYTGGAGTWVDFDSAVGCFIRGIQLTHSNAAFLGPYVAAGNTSRDTSNSGIQDCVIGSAVSDAVLIALQGSDGFVIERNQLTHGAAGGAVTGMAAGGFANLVKIRDNGFTGCAGAPIQGLGQGWMIEGNAFEPLSSGAAGAILAGPTQKANGLTLRGNWYGDSTVAGGTWVDVDGQSVTIEGENFSDSTAGSSTGISIAGGNGFTIRTCSFNKLAAAINFAGAAGQIVIGQSVSTNCTAQFTGAANIPLGQLIVENNYGLGYPAGHYSFGANGYRPNPDGSIEMWGQTAALAVGNNAVAFPVAFPNGCLNVTATCESGTDTTANVLASAWTTAQFTASVSEAGKVNWRAVGY